MHRAGKDGFTCSVSDSQPLPASAYKGKDVAAGYPAPWYSHLPSARQAPHPAQPDPRASWALLTEPGTGTLHWGPEYGTYTQVTHATKVCSAASQGGEPG